MSYYKIVDTGPKSEIEKFASWFHQDWRLVFPDFYTGAKIYFEEVPLSEDARYVLKQELYRFLDQTEGQDPKEIVQAWFDLGAHAWQCDLDIASTLRDFAEML